MSGLSTLFKQSLRESDLRIRAMGLVQMLVDIARANLNRRDKEATLRAIIYMGEKDLATLQREVDELYTEKPDATVRASRDSATGKDEGVAK